MSEDIYKQLEDLWSQYQPKYIAPEPFDDYQLVLTCGACPEQYDVFYNGEQIAYFRLRHGIFTVDVPDCGGDTILTINSVNGKYGGGKFDDVEREHYLLEALKMVDEWRLKNVG
jgi:hypothetical protein